MTERERRIGENEAVFREVNERIEGINQAFAVTADAMDLVCECGHADCVERVAVDVQAYERVRADPTLFFLVPGHDEPDVETVVDEAAGYAVVRKDPGRPARIARETDPRSGGGMA
jgi:hypothetical protein